MEKIIIDVGVHTELFIDLTNYDFTDVEQIILTIKNSLNTAPIIEREFAGAQIHTITITPDESRLLKQGAVYDFNRKNKQGQRFKEGDTGEIILRRGCGQCQ